MTDSEWGTGACIDPDKVRATMRRRRDNAIAARQAGVRRVVKGVDEMLPRVPIQSKCDGGTHNFFV